MNTKEMWRLFEGLKAFANVSDDFESYQMFSQKWPTFFPVPLHDWEETSKQVAWKAECHQLVKVFRDGLRNLWSSGSKDLLAVLLGCSEQAQRLMNEGAQPSTLAQIFAVGMQDRSSIWEIGLREAWQKVPKEYFADLPMLYPDWKTGEFKYEPKNDFQRAVYCLWRQNWRAKVCPRCESLFVARRPPQLYCSSRCADSVKSSRALEWWKSHGKAWRDRRNTASSSNRRTRKGKTR